MSRKPDVYDHNLTRREIYNPTDHEVVFERMDEKLEYVTGAGITFGPPLIRIPAKGRAILPHMYFKFHSKHGGSVELVVIFGRDIGRGLTSPSPLRPAVKRDAFQ